MEKWMEEDEKMRCSLSRKLQKQKCAIFCKYYEKEKNQMLEKINNVNVRFLVLSVYKVQNRLLLKNREHKIFIANYR